ncbi:unnamed protein product [Rhizophagus irregularis]|nr:unnamed protein product [Rhizophagus irregularis]
MLEVVLKCFNNLNENLDEFLNEWKYHQSCSDSYEIINLYGFTKSSDTSYYMVVMDYANKGNLRGNLTKDEEEEENEVDNNLVFISDLGLCQPLLTIR